MKKPLNLRLFIMAITFAAIAVTASAQEQFVRIAGTSCDATPYLHCPDRTVPATE
ncbi:MAG: hypothetical protein M3X11_02835 [Acidobacteriota bacterium]|nr:hypothetical protein [Acidobacteriota bacterium]